MVLRARAKNNAVYCSIRLLPTTTIFQSDSVDMYLKSAQYGYPKTLVAAALGLDDIDLLQLSDYENKRLKLDEKLVPLNSSFTQNSGEKNSNSSGNGTQKANSAPDLSNEGGRPKKSITERADRTNENIDGAT